MATQIQPGRFTAEIEGDFVVFIIGMRLNKPWKLHRWVPVFRSMGPMMRQLATHPDKGLLGWQTVRGRRMVAMIQYWRSFEHLERFARNPDDPHLSAWREFNRRIGTNGDVGIYHETYRVQAGGYECLYANMPTIGLAKAGRAVPIGQTTDTARQRMSASARA